MLLSLRRVTVRHGEDAVLDAVDLDVASSETVLLKGPSGSGKTTLLQVLGLLRAPTGGTVLFEGKDTSRMRDRERAMLRLRAIGHVFQTHNMIPDLSILENVLVPMRLHGTVDEARGRTLLEAVGLAHRTEHLPAAVSVGERQRAAVARALVMRPRVVLADEPTASLDAKKAREVVELLLRLQEDHGNALVVASHDPRAWEALPRARELALHEGKIVRGSAPDGIGRIK